MDCFFFFFQLEISNNWKFPISWILIRFKLGTRSYTDQLRNTSFVIIQLQHFLKKVRTLD